MSISTRPLMGVIAAVVVGTAVLAATSPVSLAGKLITEHGAKTSGKVVPSCGKMGLPCPGKNPPVSTTQPTTTGPTHNFCYGSKPACPAGQAPFCVTYQHGGHHASVWQCVNDHRS